MSFDSVNATGRPSDTPADGLDAQAAYRAIRFARESDPRRYVGDRGDFYWDTGRSTFLLMSQFERLEEWCRLVRIVFDHPGAGLHGPFLVGSVLATSDYRDVDLRLILHDAVFDRWWSDRVRVRLVNRAVSIWGQQETGLPIDFQIQRMTEANEQFAGQARNPMGLRDWATIPTSGVPR